LHLQLVADRRFYTETNQVPLINGRFYMNPAYGRAVENALGDKTPSQSGDSTERTQPKGDGHWAPLTTATSSSTRTEIKPRAAHANGCRSAPRGWISSRNMNHSAAAFISTLRGVPRLVTDTSSSSARTLARKSPQKKQLIFSGKMQDVRRTR